ncbi:acyl-CoA N-acyltransferase [Blakeslea trispora]|nr:acyl-CoA N-acyltransferase [Blakeslea trispora]
MIPFTLIPATRDDLDIVTEYETISYHPDEAASREQLSRRIDYAATSGPELFMVARDKDNKVIGFLCSTLTTSPLVTDESMSQHEPEGKTVCLHSVCVSPDHRQQGIASNMMLAWIDRLRATGKYDRIALMSRPRLISLYERVGFKNIGQSQVVHGPEPWFDCILTFNESQ